MQVLWIVGPTAMLITSLISTAFVAWLDYYSIHEDKYLSVLQSLDPDFHTLFEEGGPRERQEQQQHPQQQIVPPPPLPAVSSANQKDLRAEQPLKSLMNIPPVTLAYIDKALTSADISDPKNAGTLAQATEPRDMRGNMVYSEAGEASCNGRSSTARLLA